MKYDQMRFTISIITLISVLIGSPATAGWYASLELGWVIDGSPFLYEFPEDIYEECIESCPQTYSDMQIGYGFRFVWDFSAYAGINTYSSNEIILARPYRNNYYIGILANPRDWLELKLYHECDHPVMFYAPVESVWFDSGSWTTLSVKMKFGRKE